MCCKRGVALCFRFLAAHEWVLRDKRDNGDNGDRRDRRDRRDIRIR